MMAGRTLAQQAPAVLREFRKGRDEANPRPNTSRPPTPRTSATSPSGTQLSYSPETDGRADPGEVVWTWVAYEDDPSQGKDRPVLVVGRSEVGVLALVLSSNADRQGQSHWLPLGSGAWDGEQRPSWVRLDRVLRMADDSIRREGAVLARSRFDEVATALRMSYGWS